MEAIDGDPVWEQEAANTIQAFADLLERWRFVNGGLYDERLSDDTLAALRHYHGTGSEKEGGGK